MSRPADNWLASMRTPRRLPIATVLALCGALAACARPTGAPAPPRAALPNPELTAQVDRIFREHDSTHSPGCAVAIVEDGRMVFARGYGLADLDHRVPLRPRSVFRIASVSKQFTAAAIRLLDREGALSLDDDIRTLLPELPDFGHRITIRDLIHHTSGLRDYLVLLTLMGRGFDDAITEADILALLSRQESLNFPPGERFLYTNTGYVLLAQIVERAAGEPLRRYARRSLFDPLGMYQTQFHDDVHAVVPERARGYAERGPREYVERVTRVSVVGDGGVFSSVEDLALWESAFVGPIPPRGDHRRDLVLFLREGMIAPGYTAGGQPVNYGFGIYHGRLGRFETLEHSGSFGGYETNVIRVPARRAAFIVFCNVSTADPIRLSREVAGVFLGRSAVSARDTLRSTSRNAATTSGDYQPDSATLDEHVGDYWSSELHVTYRIRRISDYLRLEEPERLVSALRPVERDVYRLGGITFRFERDDAGMVQRLWIDAGRALNVRFDRVGSAGDKTDR